MKVIFVLLVLFLMPALGDAQEPAHFDVFNFGLTTDISELHKAFPTSQQGAMDLSGKYIYYYQPSFVGADGKQYPGSVTGAYSQVYAKSYQVWFASGEVRNSIGYLEFGITDGQIKRLRLSFEIPESSLKKKPKTWEEDHYARQPACVEIFNPLVKRYGEPNKKSDVGEERLGYRRNHWSNSHEEMILTCYQLDGKGKELALDVVIRIKE